MHQNFFFCSRPRRFGKSLFVSTLEYIFKGEKQLFDDLFIGSTDYDFRPYPVLLFNFALLDSGTYEDFLNGMRRLVRIQAQKNGISVENDSPAYMLQDVLMSCNGKCVILIDEFDAPLVENYNNDEMLKAMRNIFSSFYSTIKNMESRIRFLFITGVTKLSNLSIFSKLNNLTDISMDRGFATAFGYTQSELEANFSDHIDRMMASRGCTFRTRFDYLRLLRAYYDGYRFSNPGRPSLISPASNADDVHEAEMSYGDARLIASVYNPVSIGRHFCNDSPQFENYWDSTGVSSLAVDLAKKVDLLYVADKATQCPLSSFTTFDIEQMASGSLDPNSVLALLYYTGYLTQDGVSIDPLHLTFPNLEVASSFSGSLVARYSMNPELVPTAIGFGRSAILKGDTIEFMNQLKAYLATYNYELTDKDRERQYQLIFLSFCHAAGLTANGEAHTDKGRIDVLVETTSQVYVIEMKFEDTATNALRQIKEMDYHRRFMPQVQGGTRTIHLVGIGFSCKERSISGWVEEILTSPTIKPAGSVS